MTPTIDLDMLSRSQVPRTNSYSLSPALRFGLNHSGSTPISGSAGTASYDLQGNSLFGSGDGLTVGATRRFRLWLGYDRYANTDSGWYTAGDIASIPVGMVADPFAGGAKLFAKAGSRTYQFAGRLYKISPKLWDYHHLLPRQFEPFFASRLSKAGLEMDDFVIKMRRWRHRLKDFGIHAGPRADSWNGRWAAWIAEHPNADMNEILDFLMQLSQEFGL